MARGRYRRRSHHRRRIRRDLLGLGLHLRRPDRPVRQPDRRDGRAAEIKNKKTLNDILEKKVDSKHYASPEIVAKRKAMHTAKVFPSIWHENKSGNISSYPYSCALRAGASYNYLLVNGERRLTPREMLRLQGFPDDFKIVVSDCQTRKQAGNAIPVDMVKMVIERFIPMAF